MLRLSNAKINDPQYPPQLEAEISCLELAGEIHQRAGQFEQAAEKLTKALDLRRQRLKCGVKPIHYSLRMMFKGEFRDAEYEQPEQFMDYAQAQIRLAQVLNELRRVYEAELLLGEAIKLSEIGINIFPDRPRYYLTSAQAFMELFLLLQSNRTADKEHAIYGAISRLNDLQRIWPNSIPWSTGHRDDQRSCDWLEKQLTDGHLGPTVTGTESNPRPFHGHRLLGVLCVEVELYETAIRELEEAVDLSSPPQAFVQLYLAIAHLRFGNKDRARELCKAAERMIHDVDGGQSNSELQQLLQTCSAELASADRDESSNDTRSTTR